MMQYSSSRVVFPCVHGSAQGELVTITCFQSRDLKGPIQMTSDIDGQSVRQIIGASRYCETDGRAAFGVIANLNNPLFSGQSYGLALALADKIARFGPAGKWSEIYATGSIPPDGCGAVGKINELKKKIKLIARQGRPNSIFIFPLENLDAEIEKAVVPLKNKGIHYIYIHHIKELNGILWDEKAEKNEPSPPFFKNRGINLQHTRNFFYRAAKEKSLQVYLVVGILILVFFSLIVFWKPNSEVQNIPYGKQFDSQKEVPAESGSQKPFNGLLKPEVQPKERLVLESELVTGDAF